MLQGKIFRHKALVAGCIIAAVLVSSIFAAANGGVAVEFGGIEMTFAPQADGRLHLSFIQVP